MKGARVAAPGEFVGERLHPVGPRPRVYEYRTTTGEVTWDDAAVSVDAADDPLPPDGDG